MRVVIERFISKEGDSSIPIAFISAPSLDEALSVADAEGLLEVGDEYRPATPQEAALRLAALMKQREGESRLRYAVGEAVIAGPFASAGVVVADDGGRYVELRVKGQCWQVDHSAIVPIVTHDPNDPTEGRLCERHKHLSADHGTCAPLHFGTPSMEGTT